MLKNIILDVDGTLWDTTEVVAKAWNKAISEVGGTKTSVTSAILKQEFGKPMDVIADRLFSDASPRDRELLLEKCCLFEEGELKEDTDDLLFPNVKETLITLSKHCRLFIVSNCQSGYIELFMKKAGVEEYITDFECFGDTGKSKGENIKLVIDRNHLDDVLYVGDTKGDYEATVEANVPFVFATYGFGTVPQYDYAIGDIKELLNLLSLD